jgi:hypothetical protein
MSGERSRSIIPSATVAERDIDDDNFRVTCRPDRRTPDLDAARHEKKVNCPDLPIRAFWTYKQFVTLPLILIVTSNDGDTDNSKGSNKGTDMGNNMGSMGMRNNTDLLERYGIP